jgi:hypothetical protein
MHKVAFCGGVLSVFVPIDIIGELTGDTGVLVVTGAAIAMIYWLYRKWRTVGSYLPPEKQYN